MTGQANMKLGHRSSGPTPHVRTLKALGTIGPLPSPPDVIDWTPGIPDWPLLRNDELGDCTVCSVLHYVQAAERWRYGVGRRATDTNAEAGYRALGWDGTGEGAGACLADVMSQWQGQGFSFLDRADRIAAFIRVDPSHLKQALWLCGPVLVGAELPLAAADQTVWSAPTALTGRDSPGSWGGHCMLLTAMDANNRCQFVTWGQTRTAEPGWVTTYICEAWAPLHPLWIASGRSPSGWAAAALQLDLALLT